jgi:uncharacterized protein (DUF58 family)
VDSSTYKTVPREGDIFRADSRLKRPIGLSGVIRLLIAVLAVIALGAATAAGRCALASVVAVFLVAAIAFAYRGWLARKAPGADVTRHPPG